MTRFVQTLLTCSVFSLLLMLPFACLPHQHPPAPPERMYKPVPPPIPDNLSKEHVKAQSEGCIACHVTDAPSMHAATTVRIGCVDCHGGDPTAHFDKEKAHVHPYDHHVFKSSANPNGGNPADLNKEPWEFVRFINPGDLRVADLTCGSCHAKEVHNVRKSMMTTGAMLWGAALYNNGGYPLKQSRFGESYSREGIAQRIHTIPPPTPEEIKYKGVVPFLSPLPRYEVQQPSNILRVFERGGRLPNLFAGGLNEANQPIPPNQDDEPGRPEQNRLSQRGYGTLTRTDPVWLNLQRTRLLDPTLNHMGTNNVAGEYRSSGCSACHVLYGNDTDPIHSEFTDPINSDEIWNSKEGNGPKTGKEGKAQTIDKTIPKDESGHPIKHVFTRAIPSSQCVSCHIHPGTTVTNSYYGYTWWDNESHGDLLYPKTEVKPDHGGFLEAKRLESNPQGSAVRGKWGDPEFLKTVTSLNDELKTRLNPTKFAEFNGHGWIFRAVYKKDRKGNLLDADGDKIDMNDPDKLEKAVHLRDIHLEKGMHCIDCHFWQDSHGNGKLYGGVRDAVEIDCIDCHGTIKNRAKLITSGTAAPKGGNNLAYGKTPWGRRFRKKGDKIVQNSMVIKGRSWVVPQVIDTLNPKHEKYNERAALAKTMQKDATSWGDASVDEKQLAHSNKSMSCFSCHTSWVTSCFGCHLNMKANRRRPTLHFEGTITRNWSSYSMMTLRDDVFMLGKDGTSQENRISPTRSTCAVIVGSQNGNREFLYSQQQTVSSPGLSGHSFATHVPHSVRAKETRFCTDCHVSTKNDNNAVMAQLMMQGTNAYNFFGRYVYVATGEKGVEAVVVGERDEPQAVIGSTLHKDAYPERYANHLANREQLTESFKHGAGGPFNAFRKGNIRTVQHRGEYLYLASGRRGLQIYDIANIDNKGFSQRFTSAPVSPLGGQQLHVKTKDATWVASPATVAVDPLREQFEENEEQKAHLSYGFLYVTDRQEGLITVLVATLLDGDPLNNFLKRALTFNPEGKLTGAEYVTMVGHYAYVLTNKKLVVVDFSDAMNPKITAEIEASLNRPKAISVQFRYAFVADADGLKVLDVTDLAHPKPVQNATVALEDGGKSIYVVRTMAYVAAGSKGIAIIDVEKPEQPKLFQYFNADGAINDTRDVKVGITNNSHFAYVADGYNGLRVVQLTSPYRTPGIGGFSPNPTPELIATYKTRGPAVNISEGVDRDRAVDESGHQIAVFNRVGGRPFNKAEMEKMYLRDGKLWTVKDEAPGKPLEFKAPEKKEGGRKKGRRRRGRRR